MPHRVAARPEGGATCPHPPPPCRPSGRSPGGSAGPSTASSTSSAPAASGRAAAPATAASSPRKTWPGLPRPSPPSTAGEGVPRDRRPRDRGTAPPPARRCPGGRPPAGLLLADRPPPGRRREGPLGRQARVPAALGPARGRGLHRRRLQAAAPAGRVTAGQGLAPGPPIRPELQRQVCVANYPFSAGGSMSEVLTVPNPNPFDPASLRLSQDFAASLGVKKALLTVPVRKPDKAWFVRVHPSEDYRLQTAVLELKEERETYLVARPLWSELAGEATLSPRALYTAVNRQGVVFL